jgi:putative transposase
MKTIRFSDS